MTKLKAVQFLKDYRLPLGATAMFVAVLLAILGIRLYERAVLADVLPSKAETGNAYATLLSNDKIDDISKNDTTEKQSPNTTTNNNSSVGTTTGSGASAGGTSSSQGNSSGGGQSTTSPGFSAGIMQFAQEGSFLDCSSGSGSSTCSVVYKFRAVVRTQTGPGQVGYRWQTSISGENKTGSFTAANGESFTPLTKEIKLSCLLPVFTFTIQFIIDTPTAASSSVLPVIHNCGNQGPSLP